MNTNTRTEATEKINEILQMDGDSTSLARIIQYTQKPKGKSYFVKAIVKDNLPYGIFNDGEEIAIYQLKRTFALPEDQKECAELIADNINRLIELRDQ